MLTWTGRQEGLGLFGLAPPLGRMQLLGHATWRSEERAFWHAGRGPSSAARFSPKRAGNIGVQGSHECCVFLARVGNAVSAALAIPGWWKCACFFGVG